MPNRLQGLKVTKVAFCARGMNQDAEVLLYKSASLPDEGQTPYTTPNAAAEPSITKEPSVADETTVAQADHDAVVAERDALKAELAALKTPEPADIDKSGLPDEVVKRLEQADADRVELEKIRKAQRDAEFVAKADEFKAIAPVDDLAPALEALDRLAPEQAQGLERALKAAVARIGEGSLFKELGVDGEPTGDDVDEKASALINKYVSDGMARPDAIRKVFAEHPELVRPTK